MVSLENPGSEVVENAIKVVRPQGNIYVVSALILDPSTSAIDGKHLRTFSPVGMLFKFSREPPLLSRD